jgi:integrase
VVESEGPVPEGDHLRVVPVDLEDLYLTDMGARTTWCGDARRVPALGGAAVGTKGGSRCRRSAILLSGIMSDHRQRFLTVAELHDLANRAGDYRLMMLVLGLCGLRFGECVALRVRSVDLMRRRLRVAESVSEVNGHMVWSTRKTHQSRDVPIPRSLTNALVVQAAGKKPEDVLFSSPNGEPILLANWRRRVWDPGVAAASLTGLRPTTCDTPQRLWRSHPRLC